MQDIASDIVVVFRDTVYSVVSPITKCLTGRNSAAWHIRHMKVEQLDCMHSATMHKLLQVHYISTVKLAVNMSRCLYLLQTDVLKSFLGTCPNPQPSPLFLSLSPLHPHRVGPHPHYSCPHSHPRPRSTQLHKSPASTIQKRSFGRMFNVQVAEFDFM